MMKNYLIFSVLGSLLVFTQVYAGDAPVVDASSNYIQVAQNDQTDAATQGNNAQNASMPNQQQAENNVADEEGSIPDNAAVNQQPLVSNQGEMQTAQNTNATANPGTGQTPDILLSRIQQMQQEILQLRGQLEVQAHDLKLLKQQQTAFYQDFDQRLNNMKGNKSSDGLRQTQTDQTAMNQQTPAAKPAPTQVAKQADPQQVAASYEAAYHLIQQKQFTQAVDAMQTFLKNYPNNPYTANAHYWLGELYLAQSETDKAIQEFTTVIQQYPQSTKVAASTLKLGFAYYDKGQTDLAKQELQKVQQQFPDTTSARLAQARLDSMQ